MWEVQKTQEQFGALPSLDIATPASMPLCGIRPTGMWEVQKTQEQFGARPSLDIATPASMPLCGIRPTGTGRDRTKLNFMKKEGS